MQFRLIYRGSLPAQRSGGRGGHVAKEKHNIRRQFHPQIKELWQQRWHLSRQLKYEYVNADIMRPGGDDAEAEKTANRFIEGKFRFLPLITEANGLACKLDILFLRRDAPGNLIENGGDIDNRIKVLFDALKVPGRGSMNDFSPEDGENPFYCLLEDDKLITEISITTDRLLTPKESDERIHDVVLIISATAKVIEVDMMTNIEFLGE